MFAYREHQDKHITIDGTPVSFSNNHLSPSESVLAALQGASPPTALIDSAANLIWHSESLADLLNLGGKSLANQIFTDAVRVRSVDAIKFSAEWVDKLKEARQSLKSVDIRVEMKSHEGVPSTFVLKITPVNGQALDPTEFCVVFQDVSESESLKASLQFTQQLHTSMFESVNAGLGDWNIDEGCIALGPRTAVMIGEEPSSWAKRSAKDFFDRCHSEDAELLTKNIEELIASNLNRIHTEFRVMHKQGYWLVFLARGQVVARNQNGRPSKITFVFIDVTELRYQDSRWKHRAQLSSDWFWSVDAKGNLSEISSEVISLLGCSTKDLIGKPILEALKLSGGLALEPIDVSAFDKRKVIKGRLIRVDRPNTPAIWIEVDAMPRYSIVGQFIGYEGVGRNVTKRQLQELEVLEAKQIAEHSNKSKSVFLATMSHEIRTPMNGVLGMAEMLSTTVLDDEQAESVGIIRQSATHLLSLIDSILDFSKLEAERVEIEERLVHVDDLVYGLAESLLPVARAKGVRLRAFSHPDIPPLFLDDTRLRQVLNNFIGNAVKFSTPELGSNGNVYVRADLKDEGLLQITVADNGIGIAPKQLDSIFDAFHQAEKSTTRRFGGTGLGLAISKKLIDLMGGMIKVDSKVGKGSTFTLLLPLKVAGEIIQHHKELEAKHCVVVGRESPQSTDLQYVLRNAGATAFLVSDMSAAFNAMNSVLRPTVFVHADVGDSEQAYSIALSEYKWDSEVSHLMITDGTRKSLRMIEEKIACADWGRAKFMASAVSLVTQDRSQIPSTSGAANKRLLGIGIPKTISKVSGSVRVLVAEDDPINQRVISRQLAHLGVTADMAKTGSEALEMWMGNKNYSLILTDLHMPLMDGYELTRRIRALESDSEHIPIVALTANAVTGETFEAYKAGIDLYLTKPILLADLSVAITTFAIDLSEQQAASVDLKEQITISEKLLADFDLETVIAILGDDEDLIRELVDQYVADIDTVIEQIDDGAQRFDAKQIKFLAHRLKSSSKSVGALRLGAIFSHLEAHPEFGASSMESLTIEKIRDAIAAFKEKTTQVFSEMKG
jgi:PAS domain S-box-containing protein